MRVIADGSTFSESPIAEEDLIMHTLAQVGDKYNNVIAAIKVRESPLSYPKLFDKLLDFEQGLKDSSNADESLFPLPTSLVENTHAKRNWRQSTQLSLA